MIHNPVRDIRAGAIAVDSLNKSTRAPHPPLAQARFGLNTTGPTLR